MEQKLEQALSASDTKDQQSRVRSVIDEAVATKSLSNLRIIVNRLMGSGNFTQQIIKPVMIHFAQQLCKLYQWEEFEEFANYFILSLKNQSGGTCDEADFIARESFFQFYLAANMLKDAALILSGINFDSTSYIISTMDKVDIYLKCAECCLEDDETVDAEVFVNRASPYMNDITDRQLQLRFRATSARVLDANRKFLEAADRYYELSCATDSGICAEDLLELFGKSIICAILAKAGPRRSRILKLLSKDEKLAAIESITKYSAHTTVLIKMTHDQLLSKEELQNFLSSLLPHQKAMTSEGYTIPEKAAIEHNLIAVAKLYDSIKLSELGILLGLETSRTEKLVAKMITEDRLKASIDQIDSMLLFDSGSSRDLEWNDRIRAICEGVSECADMI